MMIRSSSIILAAVEGVPMNTENHDTLHLLEKAIMLL